MFLRISDFEKSFKFEQECTKNIFTALTDESLNQTVNSEHRNLGRIAWHIITTYPEMMSNVDLNIEGISEKDPVPKTAKEILDAYNLVTEQLVKKVNENWKDDDLLEFKELYGEQWEKGKTLLILILHEIHHRGQITILMRQAGLKVPDIYGPAKEGWAKYGAKPPVV